MRCSWKTLLLVTLLPCTADARTREAINVSLPVDTQIQSVLLLARYTMGDCAHPETARKDRRNAGIAAVERCMGFPLAVAEALKAQGVDVELQVFNPAEPMARLEYLNAASNWSIQQRAQHPQRYVLNYLGLQQGRGNGMLMMHLEAPATDTRASLGRLDLDTFWIDAYGRPVSVEAQAKVVANTLHHRCPIHGPRQNCNDRLALVESRED